MFCLLAHPRIYKTGLVNETHKNFHRNSDGVWYLGCKIKQAGKEGFPLIFAISHTIFISKFFCIFFSGSAAPIISVWILTIEVTPGTHTIAICCLTEWQHCQVEGENKEFWCFEEATLFCKHVPKPSIDIQLYTNTWKSWLTALCSTGDITDWFEVL